MQDTVYDLDTSILIDAKDLYYAFDLVPAFWKSLVENANKGRICSIDRVRDELLRCKDDLSAWAKTEFYDWFDSTDNSDIFESYRDVMKWVHAQQQFSEAAKSDFASGADGWLIAYATVKEYTVVTHEVFKPDIQRKVPIPNVCMAFNVPYVNIFQMLRQLKVQFS